MRKYSLCWLAALVVCIAPMAAPGRAAMITGQKQGVNSPVDSPDKMFRVTLTPQTVKPLAAPTDMDLTLLKSYTKWTFNVAKNPATGTFNVLQYEGFALNTLGGADFNVLYNDGTDKPRTDYDWVQVAYPTNWGEKYDSKPKVDTLLPGSPFYGQYAPWELGSLLTTASPYAASPDIWSDETNYPQQKIQNPKGGGKVPAGDLILTDEPLLSYSSVPKNGSSSAIFDDFLVTFTWNGKQGTDSGGTVTIYDGFQWGVTINTVSSPEPTSLTLGLIGCAALAAAGWCRRRSTSPTSTS